MAKSEPALPRSAADIEAALLARALGQNHAVEPGAMHESVAWLYGLIKRPAPPYVIVVDSPLACMMALHDMRLILPELHRLVPSVSRDTGATIEGRVRGYISELSPTQQPGYGKAAQRLADLVEDKLWTPAANDVRQRLEGQLSSHDWPDIQRRVGDRVWTHVRRACNVEPQVWAEAAARLAAQPEPPVRLESWGVGLANYAESTAAFAKLGLQSGKFEPWLRFLLRGAWITVLSFDVAIVCRPPLSVTRNQVGDLQGKRAMRWADGYEMSVETLRHGPSKSAPVRSVQEFTVANLPSGARPWPDEVAKPKFLGNTQPIRLPDGLYYARERNGQLTFVARVNEGKCGHWLCLGLGEGTVDYGSTTQRLSHGTIESWSPWDDSSSAEPTDVPFHAWVSRQLAELSHDPRLGGRSW